MKKTTVNWKSRPHDEWIVDSNGQRRRNEAYIGKKTSPGAQNTSGSPSVSDIMDEMTDIDYNQQETPTPQDILQQKNVSDVKKATDLCELSLVEDSDPEQIAATLSGFENKNRPTALRGLNESEIAKVITQWQDNLYDILEQKSGKDEIPVIESNNIGGNSAASDLIARYEDGTTYPIETKFGKMTNANSGVSRITTLLGEDAFVLDNKSEMIKEFFQRDQDQEWLQQEIYKKMSEYALEFNEKDHSVNKSEMFDILHSSGAQGNSASEYNENYTILTFGAKNGEGYTEETTIDTRPDDEWDVRAEVSPEGKSTRLNYMFTNRRDPSKTVRATFNNKNSTYAESDGTIVSKDKLKKEGRLDSGLKDGTVVQLPSKFFMGNPSYNVWFKDKNRES